MGTVYALLVGINDYPVDPLEGCINDIEAAGRWLSGRVNDQPHLLRYGRRGWEVDCGRVHGLRGDERHGSGVGRQGTEFTVTTPDEAAPSVLRAGLMHADRTEVEPDGWTPDPARVYPVALSALALPPTSVSVEVPSGAATARRAADWVHEAIGAAGRPADRGLPASRDPLEPVPGGRRDPERSSGRALKPISTEVRWCRGRRGTARPTAPRWRGAAGTRRA